jgi:hypothetical protein
LAGIPKCWEPLLGEILFDAVERRQTELSARGGSVDDKLLQEMFSECPARADIQWWRLRPKDIQLNLHAKKPFDTVAEVLTTAQSHALIATSYMDPSSLEMAIPIIRSALDRGIAVDFLWGDSVPSSSEARVQVLGMLSNLAAEATHERMRLLKYNSQASGIGFNLLLANTEAGYTAFVGFLPWLKHSEPVVREGSWLRLSHPGMISELARFLADAVMQDSDLRASSTPIRLRNEASDLARIFAVNQTEYNEGDIEARFIFDDQHVAASLQMLAQAEESVSVVSDEMSANNPQGLFPILCGALQRKALALRAFSQLTGEAKEAEAIQDFIKLGGHLHALKSTGPSFMVTDGKIATLTSFEFLSSSMKSTGRRGRELGINLRNTALAIELLGWVADAHESK